MLCNVSPDNLLALKTIGLPDKGECFEVDFVLSRGLDASGTLALDFRQGIYSQNGVLAAFEDLVSFSRASGSATYWDENGVLQTAAVDEPRFEYNRATGDFEGLRVEGQSTNLVLQSTDVSDPAWSGQGNFNYTPVSSCIAGQTAQRVENLGNGTRGNAIITGTFTGSPETVSVIVENDNAVAFAVSLLDSTTTTHVTRVDVDFNTLAGSITSGVGYFRIVDLGIGPNGGQMVWISVTGTGTLGNDKQLIIYPTGRSTNTDSAIVHHGQHEEAPGATNPIVTGSSSVTRAMDQASVDISFLDGSDEITMMGVGRGGTNTSSGTNSAALVYTQGPGNNNLESIGVVLRDFNLDNNYSPHVRLFSGGSSYGSSIMPPVDPQERYRAATAISSGNLEFVVNGLSVDEHSSASVQVPQMGTLWIGTFASGVSWPWSGTIERIVLYNKRLPTASLEELTQ